VIITEDGVGANEIAANSITADQINTLELDATELTISDDPTSPSGGLQFQEDSGFVEMIPIEDNAGLGNSFDRFDFAFFNNTVTDSLAVGTGFTADPSESVFAPSGTSSNVEIVEFGGEASVRPTTDGAGFVGNDDNAWASMRAGAFIEDSPDPEVRARLDELPYCEWYAPPEYVAREQAAREDGGGEDDHGVELGTMTNYLLLEVTKAQQETIDDLEQRLTRLESEADI